MTDELNIRHILGAATDQIGSPLNASDIIRASRTRRRRPLQIIAGVAATLAVGTIAVVGISSSTSPVSDSAGQGISLQNPEGDTAESSVLESDSSAIKRAPAERINLCTGTLAEVVPSRFGLELVSNFPDTTSGGTFVAGTVTMTNTGTAPVTGYTSVTPAITVSRDGIVLWHTNGVTTMEIVEVSLAPGESLEFAASFTPVACAVDDDLRDSFRDSLPALPAGEYQISAAIDFLGSDSADLVTGPRETITIN
ncbi:MAG: hypothetical protein ACOH1J_03375 [Microbacteriaceae bacterium]